MRSIRILLILTFLMTFSKIFSQDLGAYQWKNRIILLKDTHLDSDWLQAQLKRLRFNSEALLEREVLLFLLTDTSVYDEKLNKTSLQVAAIVTKYELSNFEGLVLIGKDGSTKLKEQFIVNPSTIFDLIDGMPMRAAEIKNKP